MQIKLTKIGGRLVRPDASGLVFQLAGVAILHPVKEVFAARLRRAAAHRKACARTRVG